MTHKFGINRNSNNKKRFVDGERLTFKQINQNGIKRFGWEPMESKYKLHWWDTKGEWNKETVWMSDGNRWPASNQKKKYALTPNCHGQPSVSLGRQCSAGNGFL